jgi:hypothetical protein
VMRCVTTVLRHPYLGKIAGRQPHTVRGTRVRDELAGWDASRSLNKTWSMVVEETLPAKREAQTKLYTSYAWSVPSALEAALGHVR